MYEVSQIEEAAMVIRDEWGTRHILAICYETAECSSPSKIWLYLYGTMV